MRTRIEPRKLNTSHSPAGLLSCICSFHFISKQVAMLLYSLLILQLIQMITAPSVAVVNFETSAKSVNEGDAVEICVVADDTYVFTLQVYVTVVANGGTAVRGTDFTSESEFKIDITAGNTRACDTIPTARDDNIEPDETFVLQVMTKDPSSFNPGTMNKMTITIKDVAPCNCKDRLIKLACKDMEMKGKSLPLPCQSALGN